MLRNSENTQTELPMLRGLVHQKHVWSSLFQAVEAFEKGAYPCQSGLKSKPAWLTEIAKWRADCGTRYEWTMVVHQQVVSICVSKLSHPIRGPSTVCRRDKLSFGSLHNLPKLSVSRQHCKQAAAVILCMNVWSASLRLAIVIWQLVSCVSAWQSGQLTQCMPVTSPNWRRSFGQLGTMTADSVGLHHERRQYWVHIFILYKYRSLVRIQSDGKDSDKIVWNLKKIQIGFCVKSDTGPKFAQNLA